MGSKNQAINFNGPVLESIDITSIIVPFTFSAAIFESCRGYGNFAYFSVPVVAVSPFSLDLHEHTAEICTINHQHEFYDEARISIDLKLLEGFA